MSPERWQRIEEVYCSVVERAPDQRSAFLAEICGSDDELRREVESLLRHGDSQEALVDRPAWEAAGELLDTHAVDRTRELAGHRISHYEIVEKLGEGGMGAVYKARDTRLGRLVAIKTLPREKMEDPDRKRRFVQEAKAASALNHANIVSVYDIDQAGGVEFIAMEYVPGNTLGDLIGRKGLPLSRALDYAVQMAGALAAAHAAGIVHRDLKPGNIMVTETGVVKLLDFGVAKLTQLPEPRATAGSAPVKTEAGAIVGTTAYMSPEQAEGKPVDARSDIFSFGSVLYEMLTGRPPFQHATPALTLAAILHLEPPPLPSGMPHELGTLIARCLHKDRGRRFQHMDDLKVALEELKEESASSKLASAAPVLRKRRRWFWAAGFAALAVLVAMVGWWLVPGREGMAGPPLRKFAYMPGEGVEAVAISPDGKQIAYVSGNRLWVQNLEQTRPRELEGTQGARRPFWSPESNAIGFTQNGALQRISLRGGEVITICKLPGDPRLASGSWSADGGTIVFRSGMPARLYAVSSAGGEPEAVIDKHQGDETDPQWLPPGVKRQRLLYTASPSRIMLLDRETGEQRAIRRGFEAVYSPTGHLLFRNTGSTRSAASLLAVPFSLEKMETTGEPFQVAQNVLSASVSLDGTLVYREGGDEKWQLIWRDRSGAELGAIGQPQKNIWEPRLSPDGTKVAASGDEDQRDIWIHDTTRPVKTRLTADLDRDVNAAWSADGRYITYTSARAAGWRALRAPADGSGATDTIWSFDKTSYVYMCSWSPRGEYLLYSVAGANGAQDIGYLQRRAKDGFEPVAFQQTAADERPGDFSPDCRYVVYFSDESGRFEVYVRSFPSGSGLSQVSANGGIQPRWSRDGKEIFYVEGDTLVAVSVTTRSGFAVVGAPKKLFQSAGFRAADPILAQYDFTADGQRFVTVEQMNTSKPVIRVVQNWFAEFRDRK